MKKNEVFMEITMESKSQAPNPKAHSAPQRMPKPYDLREGAMEFAVRIPAIAAEIKKEGDGPTVVDQIARSGPSVVANAEEADGAVPRADKRRRFVIARKEARETRYWLRLIDRVWGNKVSVRKDIAETTELVHILSASIDKLG